MRIDSVSPIAASPVSSPPARSSASSAASLPMTGSTPTSAQIEGTSAQIGVVAASYSTTAGGKSYAASVEEISGGTFVASAEVPPEATATGSSPQAAEESLNARIDALV